MANIIGAAGSGGLSLFGGDDDGGGSRPWWRELFKNVNDFVGSDLGNLLIRLGGANVQQGLNEEARAQQMQEVERARGLFGDLLELPGRSEALGDRLGRLSGLNLQRTAQGLERNLGFGSSLQRNLRGLPGQFGEQNQNILDQFRSAAGGIQGQFDTGAAGINQAFQDRLGEGLGILEGRGAQAEEDIATRFRESLGGQQADLQARGFGGTLRANLAQGSAREESAEQRRLQEQLRGERLGVFERLSGDSLLARERLLGAETDLAAGFAGEQLGGAQRGQEFLGDLNLGVQGLFGGINEFLQSARAANRQGNLANQFEIGQFPIDSSRQSFNDILSKLGPIDIRAPQQLQF